MKLLRHAFAIGAVVLAGCTFAGLADYEIATCDPEHPLESCAALDPGSTSCRRWQCERATKRCVLGVLDEDNDGDPSIRCGGSDCDDHDPKRSGKQIEVCDGIDNDCEGRIDQGVVVSNDGERSFLLGDRRDGGSDVRLVNARDAIWASYVGSGSDCVRGAVLDPAKDAGAACLASALDTPGGAVAHTRTPDFVSADALLAAASGSAFVDDHVTSSCARGRVGYASHFATGASGVTGSDCGGALPSLAPFPLSPTALVAYYDVAPAARVDPVAECAVVLGAPLVVRWVDAPGSIEPRFSNGHATLGTAKSTRVPALLPLGSTVIVASPLEDATGLWSITADERVIPLARGFLAGSRAVALATSETQLAVAAEIGCTPSQSIAIAVTGLDPTASELAPRGGAFTVFEVASSSERATAPAVTWIAAYREWWVTWIADGETSMLRRIAADARSGDAPIAIGRGRAAALRATEQGVSAFVLRTDESAVDEIPIGCR